jgi:hypothetical protein
MSQVTSPIVQVLHRLPGRVRLHLPGWSGQGPEELELTLRRVPGVHAARADGLTGNVLIHFDPSAVGETELTAVLERAVSQAWTKAPRHEPAPALVEEGAPAGGGLSGVLRFLARQVLSEVVFCAVVAVEPFGLPAAVWWLVQVGLDVLVSASPAPSVRVWGAHPTLDYQPSFASAA